MRFAEAADQLQDLLEELVTFERDAEHLAKLAADHDQGRAEDVADQDRLGQEVGDESQLCHVAEQRHDTHQDGSQCDKRCIARWIVTGQRCDRCSGHDGAGCFRPHDHLPGRAKQGIHHHRGDGNIQTCHRIDPGQVAIRHR